MYTLCCIYYSYYYCHSGHSYQICPICAEANIWLANILLTKRLMEMWFFDLQIPRSYRCIGTTIFRGGSPYRIVENLVASEKPRGILQFRICIVLTISHSLRQLN